MKHVAESWVAAFNRRDLEALLALYHDQASHYSPKLKQRQPETQGLIHGKAALRAWWQDAFDRLPSLQYVDVRYTADADAGRVFFEYTRRLQGDPDMAVAEVLELEGGLIVASRVYHG